MTKKMKKPALLLIPAILILSACTTTPPTTDNQPQYQPTTTTQQTETQPTTPDPQPPIETPPTIDAPQSFTLPLPTHTITLDQNIQEVITALGTPLGIFEAPSCAFDGIDRIFSFPGLQIHTYPHNDTDLIHTISIRDDSILTQNGIYLGNTWAQVLAQYGNDYQHEFGMFTFTKGATTLQFFVENDMVTAITYGLIMN